MSNNIYFEKFTSEKDFLDYWKLVSNEKIMIINYGFSSFKTYEINDGSLAEMFIKSYEI